MRYLAWLLLLANLGMLVWIVTQPEPQVLRYRPVPVPPGIEPLVLLSERRVKPGTETAPVQEEQATAANVPTAPAAAVTAEREPAVAASVAASETAPEDGPSRAAIKATSAQPRSCRMVGPVLAESDAKSISEQLTAQGFGSQVRTEEVRKPAGYWVFMPAMPAADARRMVAELDAHGLTDHYVGKQNYISLGIFSRKEKAQQHLDHIKALGFDAILDQRYRTRTQYWLEVADGDTPLPASRVWEKIHAQFPDIGAQGASCE